MAYNVNSVTVMNLEKQNTCPKNLISDIVMIRHVTDSCLNNSENFPGSSSWIIYSECSSIITLDKNLFHAYYQSN